jgi:hypothetical protein
VAERIKNEFTTQLKNRLLDSFEHASLRKLKRQMKTSIKEIIDQLPENLPEQLMQKYEQQVKQYDDEMTVLLRDHFKISPEAISTLLSRVESSLKTVC